MVYNEHNQLKRYFVRPEPFLSTNQHFLDGASTEAPAPEFRHSTHKKSVFAKLYEGSHHFTEKRLAETNATLKSTADAKAKLDLFPAPLMHTRTLPSATYRGNGSFTVEYPHSNLTYRSLRLVPYAQLSWKSEYGDKYTKKDPSTYRGYSTLSTRR